MTASIPTLVLRHKAIHREIETEQRRLRPDPLRLMRLKRLRLMFNDVIEVETRKASRKAAPTPFGADVSTAGR